MSLERNKTDIWKQARACAVWLLLLVTGFNGAAQVGPPPVIMVQPQSQTVLAGGAAIFSVTVVSGTNPTFKWLHDGSYIAGANSSLYTKLGVQGADAGQYRVEVRNAAGTVTSSNATLTVITGTLQAVSARMTTNGFQVQWSAPIGATVVTLASTNTLNWTPISTNLATAGNVAVTDAFAKNLPSRFYRAYLQ